MAADSTTTRDTEPAQGGDFRRTAARIALAAILVVVGIMAYNRFTGDEGDGVEGGGRGGDIGPGSGSDAELGASDDVEVTTTFADPGAPVPPTCPRLDGTSPRQLQFSGPPPMCIDPTLDWRATVWTTRGYFDIDLDADTAPVAVNNFIFLALWDFYDGVGFHRVEPDSLIQAGDPMGRGPGCEGPGCGGPGYSFTGERPTDGPPFYPVSSVALANTEPGTDGSHFFVVVGPRGEALPPSYSRLGNVIAGMPVVEGIAETGQELDRDGVPTDLTVIEDISVWVGGDRPAQDEGEIGLNPGG